MQRDICARVSEATAVVVAFAGALGDFVLALPALRLLRRRHEGRWLVLAVRAPLVALATRVGCADRVARLDDHEMAALLGGGGAPGWWPGRPRLYSWFGADDASIQARLRAHAAEAVFLRVERGEGRVHAACAYTESVGERRSWQELVALAALAPRAPSDAGRRLVVHRGAGSLAKRWGADGFAEVAHWWRGRGGEVVDLLGPAEAELPALPGAQVLRDAPLPAVIDVLARAGAYVGSDSGPSQLAGAVGTGGVVLFGPTDPARWRPPSRRLAVVRALPASCGPRGFDDPPARVVIEHLAKTALP
jgi:heptosyltransferase-3